MLRLKDERAKGRQEHLNNGQRLPVCLGETLSNHDTSEGFQQ